MKTIFNTAVLLVLLFANNMYAQDVTTVRANNRDISDNLDLKAVASVFGDSKDLEDFERRLNDPEIQLSNLDLNGDGRVDYLRVIEATEGNTHLIILQSVLGADTFQDVATIEVERDRNNNVQVQVVGDTFMYGPNYIYEPVYVSRPFLFDVFWVSSYRPYYSPWYWGYYPTYYSYWAPYPVYRYRNNIHNHINVRNTYHYASTRRSNRAVAMYNTRRSNAYERQNPTNTFTRRTNATNKYALEQTRTGGSRPAAASSLRSNGTRATTLNGVRGTENNTVRNTNVNTVRSNGSNNVRNFDNNNAAGSRSNTVTRGSNTITQPVRNTATQSVRRTSAPARSFDNGSTVRSNPATTTRNMATPQSNVTRTAPIQSAPAVRNTQAPAVRNSTQMPSMRSSSPAPQRQQSAPAPSRSSGGGTRSSRG